MKLRCALDSLAEDKGRFVACCLLLSLLHLYGCSTTGSVPSEWRPLAPQSEAAVETPLGRFSNHGESDNEAIEPPTLSALLFDELLEGFEIDNIEFAKVDASNSRLLIRPHVGDIAINEQRLFEAEQEKDGSLVWTTKTKTTFAGGYAVSASILWTGGALMPVAEWKRYHFQIADDGALLVHLEKGVLVDFFYFFPVPLTEEIWLRFPAYRAEAQEI